MSVSCHCLLAGHLPRFFKAVGKVVLDKVGVRYVPRVLVVTSGTEVVLRNKESPCRGFEVKGGNPRLDNSHNLKVVEGTERRITLRGPDICSVTCSLRPYAKGYIKVVDTPYFAVTDAEGQFAIRGVPAGEYLVTVWHEAVGRFGKEAGPIEVTVGGKGEHMLNFRLKRAEAKAK